MDHWCLYLRNVSLVEKGTLGKMSLFWRPFSFLYHTFLGYKLEVLVAVEC